MQLRPVRLDLDDLDGGGALARRAAAARRDHEQVEAQDERGREQRHDGVVGDVVGDAAFGHQLEVLGGVDARAARGLRLCPLADVLEGVGRGARAVASRRQLEHAEVRQQHDADAVPEDRAVRVVDFGQWACRARAREQRRDQGPGSRITRIHVPGDEGSDRQWVWRHEPLIGLQDLDLKESQQG